MGMKSHPKAQQYKTIKLTTEMISLNFTKIYNKIKIYMAHKPIVEMALIKTTV